jgi:hypothetical protein
MWQYPLFLCAVLGVQYMMQPSAWAHPVAVGCCVAGGLLVMLQDFATVMNDGIPIEQDPIAGAAPGTLATT